MDALAIYLFIITVYTIIFKVLVYITHAKILKLTTIITHKRRMYRNMTEYYKGFGFKQLNHSHSASKAKFSVGCSLMVIHIKSNRP